MTFDDRSHDRQAQARAGDIAGRAAAKESLEQPRLLGLWNATSRVGDARDDLALIGSDGDSDAAAGPRELDRVRDQIVEDLGDPLGICKRMSRAVLLELEREALRVRDR